MLNSATHHHTILKNQWRTSPLGWFVSLSLLLHGTALLLPRQESELSISAPSSATLAIHLSDRRMPMPVSEPQPPTGSSENEATMPLIQKAPPSKAPSSAKTVLMQATAGITEKDPSRQSELETTAETKAIDEAALQSHLKVILQQEVARYFNYPLLARRRGWQGEVLLAFRLEADGRIVDARIARSSGYGVLDRAALIALNKVKRIASGNQSGFAMQLPVIYRLEG